MRGYLNDNKINYILFHLNQVFELNDLIRSNIVFTKDINKISQIRKKIIFQLSPYDLNINTIKSIESIPILFPLGDSDKFYSFINNNLIFHDDLIKSAFYLLSGYQENIILERESLGRFSHTGSIQHRLGILKKPIVNYYFKKIIEGIVEYCKVFKVTYRKRELSNNFIFNLTHDVDRIDLYTLNYLLYKIKSVLGLVKTRYSFKQNVKLVLEGFTQLFSIRRKNPYWDFSYLRAIEKSLNLRSVFYFLERDLKNKDSKYSINNKRIRNLIAYLEKEKCEIGLHGTIRSATSMEQMQRIMQIIRNVSYQKEFGIRQHRLIFEYQKTPFIQENVELKYDTSLGFPEYEGFRNSYCLPFRLYNFEEDEIFNIWEIPLNVMDCTLLEYRNLTFKEARESVIEIINEVKRFHGIFTLLWHNGYFDEMLFPGIKKFYEDLLHLIVSFGPQNYLPIEIIKRLNENEDFISSNFLYE
jgi:hypothetical protein